MRFFFAHPVLPSVHARSARVGTGERESGRDRGQQLVVRGMLRSPTGKLDMRVARIPPIGAWSRYLKGKSAHAALELTHVEPVDERSETRKADAVWHFWERAGQRHDALKRVAQTPACRFLFLVFHPACRFLFPAAKSDAFHSLLELPVGLLRLPFGPKVNFRAPQRLESAGMVSCHSPLASRS